MKIGMYSITYRGVWYKGKALDIYSLMRFIKKEGWEGVEFDTERPHAAPMDLMGDDRKRLRDLSGELDLPISAISPSCDLSSPVPIRREAVICYVRECIKLAHDVGAPICKIFAAWRGVTIHKGLASYDLTYGSDPYPFWKDDRKGLVVESIKELAKTADDHGVVLALQNHGPDVVRGYKDVLSLIREVRSPAFKACIDLCNEEKPGIESPEYAAKVVKETGKHMVHSHFNGEFKRNADGGIEIAYDDFFKDRKPAYGAFVDALVRSGYEGFMNWEFCHPAKERGKPAGIDYVHRNTSLALAYMKKLRAEAQDRAKAGKGRGR
jgi:D-psicose/D-tagatose/L-ribulose 3-epimerase